MINLVPKLRLGMPSRSSASRIKAHPGSLAQSCESKQSFEACVPKQSLGTSEFFMPAMEQFMRTRHVLLVAMIGLFSLLFGALFSTLGGLIGGTLFKVEPPPAPPASGGGSWDVGGPTTGGVAPGGPASPSGWEPPPVR